uniref:RNA-directed RNA polymerase n=1 Tax=Paradise bay virus TaxID=2739772 RepID=A0A859D185_9TOMB|nr:RNA-dependent RNA polymerase [Paradise bay virus]
MALRPSRPGSWVRRIGDSPHRRMYFVLYIPLGFDIPIMHDCCSCNELVSIRNRVQMVTDPPDPLAVRELKALSKKLARAVGHIEPLSGEWISRYPKRKRQRYERAQADLGIRPLGRRDRTVHAFLKAEKVDESGKDPRMIQSRSPRFNLIFGDYTRALESVLYRLTHSRCRRLPVGGRLIAKGLNQRDRAREILRKWDLFGCAVSLDLSRFDAHVSKELLLVGHVFYLTAFRNDKLLRQVLSYQLENKCYSQSWNYNSVGGRMSGDMDTALGNCLLALLITVASMEALGFRPDDWSCFVDGDDILLFASKPPIHGLVEQFKRFGQELKVEGVARTIHEVQHCWGRPVRTSLGWTMAGSMRRVVSRTLVGCRHWHDRSFWPKYLGLLGYCELALSQGVPVLQEYALMLLRWSGGQLPRKPEAIAEERWHKASLQVIAGRLPAPVPVTAVARAHYALAWGVEPDEQRFWESLFRHQPPP